MLILEEYQRNIVKKGYEILRDYGILYLAMEMRTGKTITSLSLAEVMGANRVLFITKKKAIGSVVSDYRASGYDFTLRAINYEALDKLEGEYDFIIVDEAHSLGAYPKPSLRTQRIKEIVGAKPLVFLSGTPTPESYSQIYHQLWIHDHSPFLQYKNFYKWGKEFVHIREKMINGYRINDYSRADEKRVWNEMKHLFITFTQEQAGFKAEIEEEVKSISMDERIYTLSDILVNERYYRMKDGSEIVCDTAAKLKTKLHQISSGTVITEDGELKILDRTKAQFIKKEYSGKKIAIFYLFQAEGQLLKETFPNWTNVDKEFNENDDLVYICQIQSGSMGTDLSTADVIIFYNIHFASVLYWQARMRSQKIHKKESSIIHWIFSDRGIEKDIYKAVIKKKDFTTSYFTRNYLRAS